MMRRFLRHVPLAFLALVAACGTPPPPRTHSIAVTTTPPGASCVATRNEQRIATIPSTPAVLVASLSSREIELSCQAEGHETTTATIEPIALHGQGAVSLLLVGLGGTAVLAAQGELHKYPESFSLTLTPSSFITVEQRDRIYDAKREELRRLLDRRVEETRQLCQPNDVNHCRMIMQPAEAARAAALETLERQRQAARIIG